MATTKRRGVVRAADLSFEGMTNEAALAWAVRALDELGRRAADVAELLDESSPREALYEAHSFATRVGTLVPLRFPALRDAAQDAYWAEHRIGELVTAATERSDDAR